MSEQDARSLGLGDSFDAALQAIKSGDVETLSRLLGENRPLANARADDNPLIIQCADWPGRWSRRLESAKILIDAGADVDARGKNTETTLQGAVSCYDAALAELLVDAGASVDGADDDRRPLAQALFYEATEAAEMLVRRGATVDLEFAAGLGRYDLISTFFDRNGNLLPRAGSHHPPVSGPIQPADESRAELLEQALVYASINGKIEAAAYLLDRGADVNARPSGFTHQMAPVNWAGRHSHMVEFLVKRGAEPPPKEDEAN